MKKYAIYYGLGGGFGGANFSHIEEFKNEDQAREYAWEMAIEHYHGYTGLHGLRDIDDIMEEEGVSEDEAFEIMNQDAESWIDYDAVEVEEGQTEEDFE